MSLRRYRNTRYSKPNARGYAKPYETEMNQGIMICLCYHKKTGSPRAFYLHHTKGWRSDGPGRVKDGNK